MPERFLSQVRTGLCPPSSASAALRSNVRRAVSNTQPRRSRAVSSAHEFPAARCAKRNGVSRPRPCAAGALAAGAVEGRAVDESRCVFCSLACDARRRLGSRSDISVPGCARPERARIQSGAGAVSPRNAANTRARFTAPSRIAHRDPADARAICRGVRPSDRERAGAIACAASLPPVAGRLMPDRRARQLRRSTSSTAPKPARGRSHERTSGGPFMARSSASRTRARFRAAAIDDHSRPAVLRAVRKGETGRPRGAAAAAVAAAAAPSAVRGRAGECLTAVVVNVARLRPSRARSGDVFFSRAASSAARCTASATAPFCSALVRSFQE